LKKEIAQHLFCDGTIITKYEDMGIIKRNKNGKYDLDDCRKGVLKYFRGVRRDVQLMQAALIFRLSAPSLLFRSASALIVKTLLLKASMCGPRSSATWCALLSPLHANACSVL
jgi:hypothetical protein